VALSPTPAGIALANRANVDVEAADQSYFAALGEHDLAVFTRCLGVLDHRAESTR
jgi:hypothetical protein